MNIQIRVAAQQALQQMRAMQAQIAATRAQVAQLQAQTAGGGAAAAAAGLASPRRQQEMAKWGNQIQWTGRQIEYNFTLPILAAGAAATTFQLQNEKAFTQVSKVYGDTQAAAAQFMREQKGLTEEMATQQATQIFAAELDALGDAFEALSNHYGVQQKAVLEVAGAWAAAGASGVDLAKSTELSLQASILGSFDAVKATESLIAIQAQYSLSTEQLTEALATLNAVENQTGISMEGLIEGFARSAGVAREAGVDVRHLAAFLAAMTPAAGSAAQAGNALKTIISRLMSPTAEASQVMNEMGLNIDKMQWQSATATERLLIMSKTFAGLSDSQKQVASAVIASRWQINKFNVLMRELNSNTGFYQKALDATVDRSKIFTQMQKELNNVLSSSPKRLEQIWYTLQNASADIIQPMIPYIIYLAGVIKDLVVAFSGLDPQLQKFLLLGALTLALVGPLIRYLGSTATLIAELGKGFRFFLKPLSAVAMMFGLFGRNAATATQAAAKGPGIFARLSAVIGGMFGRIPGGVAFWSALMLTPAVAKQIFSVNFALAKFVLVDAIVNGLRSGSALLIKGIQAALATPLRIAVGQALLNLGALVGIVQLFMRRITAAIVASGIPNAVAGIILSIMRLGMVTGPLTGIWGRAAMAWERIWGAMYTAFMLTFGVLPRIVAAASAGIQAVWTILGTRLVVIQAAFQTRLIALFAIMNSRMGTVFAAVGRTVTGLWVAMNARLVAIWYATQLALIAAPARFLAFLKGIPAQVGAVARQLAARFIVALPAIIAAVRTLVPMILRFLTGPWGLAISAIIGLLYSFREQIAQIWNNIVEYFSDSSNGLVRGIIGAWNLLPQGVQNALVAVARVVRDAALQIYEWFSYINPFARHSPSLVENVTAGMAEVRKQFGTISSIGSNIKGAYNDIKAFGAAVRGLVGNVDSMKHAADRANIAKFVPGAIDEFDQLSRRLTSLNAQLDQLKATVDAQQAVVDRWEGALDRANAALDAQQKKLQDLEDVASRYQDQLDAAQQRLQDFASAPIAGMGAMEDAIFNNEMAQKRLRLEMMKMEDVTGPLEDVKSKIDAINGAQELLRGRQAELRAAGAGSEILKGYDAEIAKLEKQKDTYTDASDKIQKMQDSIDALQRKAERLDLEKSLKFDPLSRAIDKAANSMKELPFDQIMAGIKGAKADTDKYQAALDRANAAVDRQKNAVEAATAARDAIQTRYDAERQKLDAVKKQYDLVEQAIRDVESAMNDTVGAAEEMQRVLDEAARKAKEKKGRQPYISPGLANFRAAAGGNFADVGGAGIPQRTDWRSQVPDIKKFTDDLSRETASMFKDLNPFAPIKTKMIEFKNWLGRVWSELWGGLKDFGSHVFDGVDFGLSQSGVGDKVSGFFDWLKGIWDGAIKGLGALWRLLGPDIIGFFQNLWKGVQDVWNMVGPELAKFGDLLKPLWEGVQNVWTALKPVLAVIIGAVLATAKIFLSVLNNAIRPFIGLIGGVLTGIIRIIRGFTQVVAGIFSGDFGLIWDGVKTIFSGLVKTIWSILSGAVQTIWGVIKGIVKGIWGFFKWLYDELVGHSIVPDIVNGIVGVFKWLTSLPKWVWDNVLSPIWGKFQAIWKDYIKPGLGKIMQGIIALLKSPYTIPKWIWDNVLVPLWNKFKGIWDSYLKPGLTWIMAGLIALLKSPRTVPKWIWDNVLVPIYSKFKEWYDRYLAGRVTDIANGIKTRFQKIKDLLGWLDKSFIKPIRDAFSGLMDSIGKIWDKLQSKISGPIDGIKKWINGNLIDPLNKVVKLFGMDIPRLATGGSVNTKTMPAGSAGRYATGGRVKGFSSSSTADNIPAWLTANEYVQPVSTVRHYGVGVMEAIRHKQIPKEAFSSRGYFLGGLIDRGMKKVQSWMEKGPEYAINQIMNPAKKLIGQAFPAPEFVNKTAVGSVTKTQEQMLKWLKGTGGASGGLPSNPGLAGALQWARSQVGKPYLWGGVGPDGYDCSGFLSAITNYIQGKPLFRRRFATGMMPGGIFKPGPGAFSVAWFRGNPGHTAGTLNGVNVESRGGRGVLVGPSARGATDSLFNSGVWHLPGYARGGRVGDPPFDLLSPHGKYYNPAFPGYYGTQRLFGAANGALVKGGQGGTPVLVGEGSRDEIIKPLPSNWRSSGADKGETHIHIHGNLEFPNVTSGNDVEELVKNLEILAGDYTG